MHEVYSQEQLSHDILNIFLIGDAFMILDDISKSASFLVLKQKV